MSISNGDLLRLFLIHSGARKKQIAVAMFEFSTEAGDQLGHGRFVVGLVVPVFAPDIARQVTSTASANTDCRYKKAHEHIDFFYVGTARTRS